MQDITEFLVFLSHGTCEMEQLNSNKPEGVFLNEMTIMFYD